MVDPRSDVHLSLWDGARAPFAGIAHIARSPATWPWVIGPAVLFTALSCGSAGVGLLYAPTLANELAPTALASTRWGHNLATGAAGVLSVVGLVILSWYVTAALSGPFHDRLSVHVERHAAGEAVIEAEGFGAIVRELLTSVGHTTAAFTVWAAASCTLLALDVVPVVGPIASFFGAVFVSALMLAWQVLDYPLTRARCSFADKVLVLRTHGPAFVALGAVTLAWLAIPVANLLAPPAAVAGATLLTVRAGYRSRPI